MFTHLAETDGPLAALMIDAAHVKGASLRGGRKRAAEVQGIGRSRGGRTTKIHAAVDEFGRPEATNYSPRSSRRRARRGRTSRRLRPELCLADAAYDIDALRAPLITRGTVPCHNQQFHPQA